MALIKCPECGREISDKAPACIHCGYPLPAPKTTAPVQPRPAQPQAAVRTAAPVQPKPAAPVQSQTNTKPVSTNSVTETSRILAEAERIIKAYKPGFWPRFCSKLFAAFIVGIVGVFIEEGFNETSFGCLICFVVFGLPLLWVALKGPFRHRRKYYGKNGLDAAIRNDSGTMQLAIKVYNSMPCKEMLAYIRGLNPAAAALIDKQLAAKAQEKKK